jgi:hypothetical protein
VSLGAQGGLTAAAVERRFRTLVLFAGGLTTLPYLPEVDALHFVPHITAPTLMVNGCDDFDGPLQSAQLPLFERLGTLPAAKKHILGNTLDAWRNNVNPSPPTNAFRRSRAIGP